MSSFRRNSLWQLLQSVSSTGTDLLVVLAFSARLEPAAFGQLTVVLSIAKIVFLLCEPRIHEYLIPRLVKAGSRSGRAVWTWVRIGIGVELVANLGAAVACVMVYLFAPSLIERLAGDTRLFPFAVAFVLTSTLLKFSSIAVFRAIGKVKISALLAMAGGVLKLGVLGLALFVFKRDAATTLGALAVVSLIAALLQAGVAWGQLKRLHGGAPRFATRTLRTANRLRTARQIVSNYSMGLVEIAYRELDVQLLAALSTATEAGRYKVAKNLAMVLMEFLAPVVMMLLPEFSARAATRNWEQVLAFARKATKILVALAAIAALPMIFAVPWLVRTFMPAQVEALATFRILILGFVVCAPLLWSQSLLVAMSYSHRYVIASASGAVISLVLAAALIPTFGSEGSAFAYGVGLFTVSALASWFAIALVREEGSRTRPRSRPQK